MEQTTNTEAALTPQEQALQKAKSTAEKKFELAIAETAQLVQQCNAIVISDSTTLGMANQLLSKANTRLKEVEVKRKEIIRPSQDYIDFVNELVKSKLTNPLKDTVEKGKLSLRTWNEKEVKKENELKAEENKRFVFLQTCVSNMQKQVDLADSVERCNSVINAINNQWPSDDKFGSYLSEATKTKNNFIVLLDTKKVALQGALSNNLSVVTEAIEQISTTASEQAQVNESLVEKKEVIQDSIQAETGSVRRVWRYRLVEEKLLPREFLSIDDKKVKEYLSKNKENFNPSGTIKGGIEFYLDAQPIIK